MHECEDLEGLIRRIDKNIKQPQMKEGRPYIRRVIASMSKRTRRRRGRKAKLHTKLCFQSTKETGKEYKHKHQRVAVTKKEEQKIRTKSGKKNKN